ncbi:Smr/MutS family protein [Mycoplasma elephantis]|uniref:Smr/MutS family protein n=1 Tax=Mycoplasma elephantis TaxID=114882 RepID=UPI00048836D5|nr:Smr/MutS family protein [Mycoplasma elephantis]
MSKRKIKKNKYYEPHIQADYNFGISEYDLHGMYVDEMISFVTTKLIGLNEVIFVTGRGTGALKTALEDFLDSEGITYTLINDGKYLVRK